MQGLPFAVIESNEESRRNARYRGQRRAAQVEL